MGIYGYIWLYMGMYGYIWVYMGMYGQQYEWVGYQVVCIIGSNTY